MITPIFMYIISPIAIIASIFNLFLLGEILDRVSTLTYHQFETITDILMIIYLFYQFHLPELISCFVESAITGDIEFSDNYSYGSFGETFFFLLPTITNTLLAIDRCHCVTSPLLWKQKYGTQKYAKWMIVKIVLVGICLCIATIGFIHLWAYIIDANRVALNITNPDWRIGYIFSQYRPICCEVFTISVSLTCIIIQIRSLYIFIKTIKQQTKNASDAKNQKKIRSASQLVAGTVGTQMFISIIFLPSNINNLIANIYYAIFMDEAGAKFFQNAKDTCNIYYINYSGNLLEKFIQDGESLYWPKMNIFTSTISIIIHLVTCPAYRRGANRFIKKVFCCKKINKVGTTITVGTTQQTRAATTKRY
jgi:hypothetical protein